MRLSRRAALTALALAPAAARAAFPEKSIRLVVPFAPGGNVDVVARILAPRLSAYLGQSVVVENRAGAGGSIGAAEIARSRPDGYNLLMGSNGPLTVDVVAQANLPYDPLKDFTPIALAARAPLTILVTKSLPPRTLAEFIAYVRARPDQVGVGTPGTGSTAHLALALFASMAKAPLLHVPYRGGGALVPDLVAGNLPAAIAELSSTLPLHRDGQARILAIAATHRSAQLPDVPTVIESGVPGFTATSYVGLLGPAGLPEEMRRTLLEAMGKALAEPETRQKLTDTGAELASAQEATPTGFATLLREELAKARHAAEIAGLKPE
jgi:tripartite-type tricarboxylate transporter receptor subunit TctC